MPRPGPGGRRSGTHSVQHPSAIPATRPRGAANAARDGHHAAATARDARYAVGTAHGACHSADPPAASGGDIA